MIIAIILVVLFLSLLVIIHEIGHFVVARRNGIKVEEFGIGFPPRIFKITRKDTIYSLNLFPVGGFVKIKGENALKKGGKDKDSFAYKSAWTKTKVLLAGVAMNLVLAYLIILILCISGLPSIMKSFAPSGFRPIDSGRDGLTIFYVSDNSPAKKANLKVGDKIISIDDIKFTSNEQLADYNEKNAGKNVNVKYVSAYSNLEKSIELNLNSQNINNAGYMGVVSSYQSDFRYQLWQAPIVAMIITFKMVVATIVGLLNLLVNLVVSRKVSEGVAGPVGITVILSQVQKLGINYLLILLASISVSLAVINALPIPALDGGRVFIVLLDKLGVKISPKFEQMAHVVGFVLLIILMIIVTIRDVLKLKL